MNTQITAIFQGGVLKPTVPLALPEGARVEVIVLDPSNRGAESPAKVLAGIAAMPMEQGNHIAGRDHDQILYGSRETPVHPGPSIGIRDEDWPTDPEGIARLLALIDSLEPLEMTPAEEAEWDATRKAQTEYVRSRDAERVERIQRSFQ